MELLIILKGRATNFLCRRCSDWTILSDRAAPDIHKYIRKFVYFTLFLSLNNIQKGCTTLTKNK